MTALATPTLRSGSRTSDVTWASRPCLRFRSRKKPQKPAFFAPRITPGRDAHVTFGAVAVLLNVASLR